MAEDVLLVAAGGAQVGAHVFDDAEDGHLEFSEHHDGLGGHGHRQILRRRDDHGSGQGNRLAQAQLNVAGAGRQVHHQIVELAPFDISQKLLDGLVQHRPAPDDGVIFREKIGHGDQLHTVLDGRDQSIAGNGRRLFGAHQDRDAGSIDIRIHQAHRCACLCERHGQVGRHGGFPHAALAAGDGNGVFHFRNQRRLFACAGSYLGRHPHLDLLDAGKRRDRLPGLGGNLISCRAGGCGELDGEGHLISFHDELLDETEGYDIASKVGVLDGLQRFQHLSFADCHFLRVPLRGKRLSFILRPPVGIVN